MATGESADLVLVGHVRKPHGVRGEVLIEVLSDDPDRFGPGAELIAIGPAFERRVLKIVSARPHRGGLLIVFEGLEDRDEVATLRGTELMVEAEAVRDAPEGSYYYFDLVGRPCRDAKAGDLGVVVAVREDGGGLLLEVRDHSRTVLVPFVREYLVSIDRKGGPIDLDLPPGLLEVCASR
jgi:16S rRNA processing protein RimM